MAYLPKAILSTGFPIVSAQENDVYDLSPQRSSLASLPVLCSKSWEVGLELHLLSKVFTAFPTAAVYSWIYTDKL